MDLMEGFMDEGRVLCTDNFYTSIELAEMLLRRKTDLIVTLRKNRKRIPKTVKEKKLKRGDVLFQQDDNGILVMKWKDKREIFLLSTKHDGSLGSSGKPALVEDYNVLKGFAASGLHPLYTKNC
ncbi:PiggyBac transposable element-derived protein 4 [Trichostrongylus colubriformis]|uniref:PiggyBac transposable element-derived protein 4 n=1 Tax=Trichostrongylus colubriformis TaxID=6319 RepID=A0AAN8G9W2_TRICO